MPVSKDRIESATSVSAYYSKVGRSERIILISCVALFINLVYCRCLITYV